MVWVRSVMSPLTKSRVEARGRSEKGGRAARFGVSLARCESRENISGASQPSYTEVELIKMCWTRKQSSLPQSESGLLACSASAMRWRFEVRLSRAVQAHE